MKLYFELVYLEAKTTASFLLKPTKSEPRSQENKRQFNKTGYMINEFILALEVSET